MPDFNVKDPHHVWQLVFQGNWPTSVAFLGSSNRLAAGNRNGDLYVWDLSAEPPAPAEGEKEKKDADPPNVWPMRKLAGHTNGITRLAVSPSMNTLLSASLDRTVRAWDLDAAPTGNEEVVLDVDRREKEAERSRKDDPLNEPGVEVETVEAAHVFDRHGDWVNGLGLSADGGRMITGDDAGLTVVHDLASRSEIARWKGHPMNGVCSAALSPDGATAFVAEYRASRGSFDRPPAQARLFDAATGEEKVDLLKVRFPDVKERDNSYAYGRTWSKFVGRGFVCSAFSPDGKLLALGQGGEIGDAKVHLVDVETGEVVRTVSGHEKGVCDVAFSADGKSVLSSGRDTVVRVCRVSDGEQVAELGKPRGGQFKDWLHALALSPDQKWLAAADIAGLIHVWKLAG